MRKRRGDAPQGYLFRFAPLRGHRPYTPNIEPHNSAFRSKSGSGKRSRDNATFRRNLLGTAFAWQMRSRYAAGEGAQRDFQTAGLNGVFGYFCRRGQKYPAPGRGISLWTIPPSTLRVDTSLYTGEALELRARGRGGAMWASPPTDGFKECGVWADGVVRPYGHIHRRCSPSYAEGDFLARKAK